MLSQGHPNNPIQRGKDEWRHRLVVAVLATEVRDICLALVYGWPILQPYIHSPLVITVRDSNKRTLGVFSDRIVKLSSSCLTSLS